MWTWGRSKLRLGSRPTAASSSLARATPARAWIPSDPVHAELIALREQVQQLSQGYEGIEDAQANAWLDQETASAAQIFEGSASTFDPEELYQYAAERELTDVSAAAKALPSTSSTSWRQGSLEPFHPSTSSTPANGRSHSSDQAVLAANSRAAGTMDRLLAAAQTPRGGMTSASRPQPQTPPGSINEAFAQTLQDLGINNLSQVDMTYA